MTTVLKQKLYKHDTFKMEMPYSGKLSKLNAYELLLKKRLVTG